MNPQAKYWIEKLEMQKHPEGGYFKETYRSQGSIPHAGLPAQFDGERSFATGIYFLLTDEAFSAFHRIRSDEMWHFYAGDGIQIYWINENRQLIIHNLGNDIESGEQFQTVVPANCWFASRVVQKGGYALVGCTVAPGFDFADFELAQRSEMLKKYPEHAEIISQLTRV